MQIKKISPNNYENPSAVNSKQWKTRSILWRAKYFPGTIQNTHGKKWYRYAIPVSAKINRMKIVLDDDHPETGRATHNGKTATWSFSWLRNAFIQLYGEAITFHFIAPYGSKAECDIWESSQAKRNIKEGIVSVWWNCEYLYGRNHFKSLLSMPTNT